MRKLLLITTFLLFSQNLFGQVVFKESKIHLKSDSIIEGDVYLFDSNPLQISINKESNRNINTIKYIENNDYLLRSIVINSTNKLLIAIVEGDSLSLYKENESKLFYAIKDDNIYNLEGGKVLIENKSKSYYRQSYQYRGILRCLSKDKPELLKKASDLDYSEKDLCIFVIEYNNNKTSFIKKESNQKGRCFSEWEVFFQYLYIKNNLYYQPNPNTTPSFYQFGTRTYIKEGSRSSISTSVEYGKNSWEHYYYYVNIIQLNFNYFVDFYKTNNSDIYLNVRLFDITYVWNNNESSYNIGPRFNVGFGYRYHIKEKLNLFVELNQLLNLEKIPSNFSLGFSYRM
ncbi:MAG: hypothetical protein KAT68_02570 [Bacteroidales bacterium]|nr:hypothetical protein [Bacteroidales bacterium]